MTETPLPKPPPADPKEIEVLDFEVIEEHWNEYELEDNTKLRGRVIVTRVARPLHGPPGLYDLSFNTTFTSTTSPSFRGKPSPPLGPEELLVKEEDISSGIKIPVKILSSIEPWNYYRIEKTTDTFQVKLLVSAVYRVKDRFDQFGEPAYVITNRPVVAPTAKGYVKLDTRKKTEK